MELLAKTFLGLEQVLADELKEIGAENIKTGNRIVYFSGNQSVMYKANMYLRCALRILLPIYNFRANNDQELYKKIYNYQWNQHMTYNDTFAIDSVVNSKIFTHSKYIALKCKDAIVDQFRDNSGKRPSINTDNPAIRINLHISEDRCTISLDTSGESLYKRGYRKERGVAPINEVLAAGMVRLTGWKGDTNFIDPMCGSGTILIEAAMIAAGIYPCALRNDYGFMHAKDFNKELYQQIKVKASPQNKNIKVFGSDISAAALECSRTNIEQAKYLSNIVLKNSDIRDFVPPDGGGIIITNPPYDERMKDEDIYLFYSSIGNVLKKNFAGYNVWIISSNFDALKQVGLHASKTFTLYNGPLKCKFQKFEIYEGSKKGTKINI
ncbi:MAG: methyltransferase [Bacteroidales bacterium]|nr:methyltransferase [Bacteroidales bacterium]